MASRAAAQADASLQRDANTCQSSSAKAVPPIILAGRACAQGDSSTLEQAGQTLMAQRQVLVRLRELAVAARDPGLVNGRRASMDAHMDRMLAQLDAAAPGPPEQPAEHAQPARNPDPPSKALGLDALGLETVERAKDSLNQLDEALSRIENDRTAVRLMLKGQNASQAASPVEADNIAAAGAGLPDAQAAGALIRAAREAVWAMAASDRAQVAPAPSADRILELFR